MAKIVIALGGNALGNDPVEQKAIVTNPASKIACLVKQGHNVVVGHGNGPQVGMIFNAFSDAKKSNAKTPYVPFAEAGGMSQGYIGYHMQTAIANSLKKLRLKNEVLYLLTQTIVSKDDPAFKNPSKPVGPFFASKNAAYEAYGSDAYIVEDAGRGFRKVVASPLPIDFLSIDAIKQAINSDNVIILGGGGGIPTIINEQGQYEGVDGVIDKDFALSKMAQIIKADIFIILTAVDKVFINYNQPNQKALDHVSVSELNDYIKANQFAKGSMLPKVQAAIEFVSHHPQAKAIIANINNLDQVLQPNSQFGTIITFKK